MKARCCLCSEPATAVTVWRDTKLSGVSFVRRDLRCRWHAGVLEDFASLGVVDALIYRALKA